MANSENKTPNTKGKSKNSPKDMDPKAPIGANTRRDEIMTFATRDGSHVKITTNPPLARYHAARQIYMNLPMAYDAIRADCGHLVVLPDTEPTNYEVISALTTIMETHITRFFIEAIVNCLDYGNPECCHDDNVDPMALLHKLIEDEAADEECPPCPEDLPDDEDFENDCFDEVKVGTVEQTTPIMFTNCHIGNLYINEKKAKNKGGDVDQSTHNIHDSDAWIDDEDDDDDFPCCGNCEECDGFSMCGENRPMSDGERGNIIHAILTNITPERLAEIEDILTGHHTPKKNRQEDDDE